MPLPTGQKKRENHDSSLLGILQNFRSLHYDC
uniref:Uncharacterized protein n=1 Tax=Rhizophora mucronata TaxID=61149 RepID=A0A2P2R1P6_RHIMU